MGVGCDEAGVCYASAHNEPERCPHNEAKETIVAAALRIWTPHPLSHKEWQGKRVYPPYMTVSAPPPARHGSLLHPLHELGIKHHHPDDQGFLTSKGRFVGRVQGLKIALASGQPMIDHPSRHATELFSEDLW